MTEPTIGRERQERRNRVRLLLWDWGQALEQVNRKRMEIEAYELWARDAAQTLKCQSLTGMPHRGGAADGVHRAVVDLERRKDLFEDAATKTTGELNDILCRKFEIDALIDKLPTIQQKILKLRYQDGHKVRYIALKLCFDKSSIERLELKAIDKLAENI